MSAIELPNSHVASASPSMNTSPWNTPPSERTRKTDSTGGDATFEASPIRSEGRFDEPVINPIFGETPSNGPKYNNMGWFGAAVLMCKTQVGIGSLTIPKSFNTLGLVPGIIALTFFSLVTTWSGHMIGKFRRNHPEVFGVEDVGILLFRRGGREFFQAVYTLYFVFVSGAALISVATGLDVLSDHKACAAALIGGSAVLGFILCSIETLNKISWVAYLGLIGILISLFAVTIGVAVQDRPAAAPQAGPWSSGWKVVGAPTFAEAMGALSQILFAYSGTAAYFPIAGEMKRPHDYFKAMYACQLVVYIVYLIVGIVVYIYCGSYVASPALGSAGPMLEKVCYGIAVPGLVVTMMIVLHLPAKSMFVRLLRGTRHLTNRTAKHWTVWLSCTSAVTILAYIIASSIPGFGNLVTLIGALFGTIISITVYPMMWLYDNWNVRERSWKWYLWYVLACFLITVGMFVMVGGSYAAIKGIMDGFSTSKFTPWGCSNSLEK